MAKVGKGGSNDVRELIQIAESLGFTASRTKGGHLKFSKEGSVPVFTSWSPGDVRSKKNCISLLKRSA